MTRHSAPPGVFVLGMHRSGTSVVTGMLDRLGLDGGSRRTMLSPDEFNSDGYWEQRPVVEWHDRVLGELGGWASAPPLPANTTNGAGGLAASFGAGAERLLDDLYRGPWFLKDPRQCLLLGLWDAVRGQQDYAVVVFRDPAGVVSSLRRRNGYSPALAAALWERYCHDLLNGLRGRRCLVVRYEDLLAEPGEWARTIAEVLPRTVPGVDPFDAATVDHAAALVRGGGGYGRAADVQLNAEQSALLELLCRVRGEHEAFVPLTIPPLSAAGQALIERRRRRLNAIRPLIRSSSSVRAALDRIPARLRPTS